MGHAWREAGPFRNKTILFVCSSSGSEVFDLTVRANSELYQATSSARETDDCLDSSYWWSEEPDRDEDSDLDEEAFMNSHTVVREYMAALTSKLGSGYRVGSAMRSHSLWAGTRTTSHAQWTGGMMQRLMTMESSGWIILLTLCYLHQQGSSLSPGPVWRPESGVVILTKSESRDCYYRVGVFVSKGEDGCGGMQIFDELSTTTVKVGWRGTEGIR